MATRYQPLIYDYDYQVFKKLMRSDDSLPGSHDEWLNLQAAERQQIISAGSLVKQIDVDPEEFQRYCQASGFECDSASLGGFAVAKAMGRTY